MTIIKIPGSDGIKAQFSECVFIVFCYRACLNY